ncbi:hypothetical protein EMIHUDRAFT_205103 [Emiliania huxleyi CCMP1516]|uniref:Helicase C-terminal domain-containing protein n=2 Tax=Emiliania huxleyi TaxID=2903 RepID=A0A0D3JUG8_EMIH1|nr:hypothetical protein EMIHUDRAFT_205103 [Emiliania huxleyi CCMP1516]EOD27153.1 hypothetical protein EMIHUDRAFT_205103 [Emiliania huxleyi CCMP1516]|eukprot:XP_005779582.1 hypothetical protein EMIHUDRAFT_205103 [Emiliania huxleyi CCMP1516]
MQNNIGELLSLMEVVDAAAFGGEERRAELLERYRTISNPEQVAELQALLRPYMLRRTKADVQEKLPLKTKTLVKVELTVPQKRVYRAVLDRNLAHIANPRASLSNAFMQLRKACNHPRLLEGGADGEEEAIRRALDAARELEESLVHGSGKMVLLHKLLPRLRRGGHKVLLFSQFKIMLDILEDYLLLRRPELGGYERVDGDVAGAERQAAIIAAIDRFQADEDCFAFLLTTRAGGQGINLTAADTVVIFDSDWNPQGDLQGQARAHRIGQSRPVKVYRLVTNNTYEQRLFERACLKLSLERALLQGDFGAARSGEQGRGGRGSSSRLSRSELDELLRYGAYGVLRGDDEAARTFCDADIDKLLEESVEVTYGDGPCAVVGGGPRGAECGGGELLFRIFHLVAKPDGLHDVRAVKEDELDYIVPAAEEEPIFLRRNRDGSLDFPPDVRPAPASAAQGSTPEESRDAQSGALVWAFAFEELGPSAPSSSALSLPGPGGVWRTAVVRRERRDRFTYQRCLVAPDGRQWRGSQLRQLAEHLFASRPEQLRQALYMLNLPPDRETGEESEGGAASGVPSPAVAAEVLPAAAVALPPAALPLLDLWSVLPGGRVTGQVFGKPGIRDGTRINTARVVEGVTPSAGSTLRTISGSNYILGEACPGVGGGAAL